MAELMNLLGELRGHPEQLHLLCPRQHDDDVGRYNEELSQEDIRGEDVKPDAVVLTRISEASARREKFLSCMQLLAFSGDEVELQQEWIWMRLEETLEKCDLCIREYYKGKVWLMETLGESYDESEVEKFSKILEEWDIKRITKNLDRAAKMLRAVPPQERTLSVLDRAAMLSIFEALSSEVILSQEDLLKSHFDEAFKLIQTNRTLKITDYVPAVTQFLFDENQDRSHWALHSWAKFTRPPTTAEFDWAIKEPLLEALRHASSQPYQGNLVQRLWSGLQLIVRRLSKEQITHNLRALEIDASRLSVDHLAVQTPGLRSLLNTVQIFLEKAPEDFWDAMHTISPPAIIEQVFYNPQYDAFLLEINENEQLEQSALKDMLSWIDPFMSSLKGAHQPQACRFLVFQLLNRLQDSRFPSFVRYNCFRAGLLALIHTLRGFTDHESSRGSVARIVLSETLEVISDNIDHFLEPPMFPVQRSDQDISSLCMDVIRNTLALECQSLKSDYEAILRQKTLQHGVSTYSAAIWDAVVQHMHEDNLPLSTAALMGILPLVGLEKFPTKGENSKEKTHFNVIYGHLTHLACQILERLADFKPEHLDDLFKGQDTSGSLISALFSADLNTYQAAVDLIKTISGQSGRKEAISHLLQSFCATTMYGFSWSFRRISNMKTFASAPRMIKTGTDILDVLCDSQTGMLRIRKLADRREIFSLQKLWEHQWQALTTIFDQTETWHLMGIDKSVMLEFCRDSIQFADLLFDQFPVFASAISEADPQQAKPAQENLLRSPATTMNGMVKWLRLKDEYLATTLVGLVAKLLRRLGELDVTVSRDALTFIEGVAMRSTVKTILTAREKAELVRSLEAYYKKPLLVTTAPPPKKQSMITAFVKPVDLSNFSSPGVSASEEGSEFDDGDIPDDVLLQLSGSVELKARLAAQKKPDKRLPVISKPKSGQTRPSQSIESFREKREREKAAKKKRDMLELAKLKKRITTRGAGGMMVSSSSDVEMDSDDEVDPGLLGRKMGTKPEAVRAYEESRKKSLHQRVPVKKSKIARSAKDMRARLSPDLSLLHRTLLGWDFFASGDFPPNSGTTDYTLVSNTFEDAMDYQRTFEPLLILEAWQGFQSAKEESSFKPFEIKVANRLSVDSFIEVSTVMQFAEVKDLGLGEADMILLSKSSNAASDPTAPHCLARISGITKRKGMMEVSYRVNMTTPMATFISPGAGLFGVKITSLTPLEREYGALMALPYYDLSDEVIKAKPSPILSYTEESLKEISAIYDLNPAQAKAVKSAMENDAFTLIQGPPGSGKTKTVIALVGAILTSSFTEQGIPASHSPTDFRPVTRTTTSKKLLVCAPSNAAVDELVMRFKKGVKTLEGKTQKISVIRLGRSDAINANVMDVTLDELVNTRLSQAVRKNGNERDLQSYYAEHKAAATSFNEVREKIEQCRAHGQPVPAELEREFDLFKRKKAELSKTIDNVRDKNHSAARDADLARRRIQQEIIDGAHVLCATLSGSGHEMFQSLSIEFETVIIDEAAQSIELSALIPLKYGCSKCILVGDPKQLPPTVLSKAASRFQYEQSLFVRMQANHPDDVHLLDTQYRMHPEISQFPSAAFYDRRLRDGPDMAKLRAKPWHGSELLGPYRFFDVQGLHTSAAKGHSLVNVAEVRVAMKLYERLINDCRSYDFSGKIGIITPYKGQLRELKAQFSSRYTNAIFSAVEFNTTDAFQGRESEVIIFSCVRASSHGIGFLADIRRMNVGLTRARSSLWVLGNSQSLVQGEFWKGLINDARARNLYTEGNVLQLLQRPQLALDIALNDVEMIDAPPSGTPDRSAPPSRPHSSIGGRISSRPSPSLSGNHLSGTEDAPSGSATVSSTQSPRMGSVHLPDGPSGGRFGLNDAAVCGYCGSFAHMTHNCDNLDAKQVSQGICSRCGDSSHSKRDCVADRCLECGDIGHLSPACKSTKILSKRERNRISKEEYHHSQIQKARLERQKKRQLGDHDPKVPIIHVSSRTSSPGFNSHNQASSKPDDIVHGKRKRADSGTLDATKESKLPKPGQYVAPSNIPKGPRGKKLDPHVIPPPDNDLVVPTKDNPGHRPLDAGLHSDTGTAPGGGKALPTPRPGPLPRPRVDGKVLPLPRKKKQVDPFIRPKRR